MSRVLILGAGISGMGAARLARRLGMAVTLYAEQSSAAGLIEGFSMASGDWDRALLDGVDHVVASPGFSERSSPVVDSLEWGVPVLSEVEFAFQHLDVPVVAVTGTNGKTTVTEATSAMLAASGFNAVATGNIGSSISDEVGVTRDLLVVEVSSFQLRFIDTFHPVAAAITNVAVDHLDWHGSAYAYTEAKARIFENQTSEDLLVFDTDDPGAARLAARAPSHRFPVSGTSVPPGGGGRSGDNLVVGDISVPLSAMRSSDPIHLVNLAAASALSIRCGASPDSVAAIAREFQAGEHRRQLIAETGGVRWVDDSKATNPHAAIASIRSHGPVILIAGGLAKGLDMVPVALEPNLRAVIGIGTAGPLLVEGAGQKGHLAGDMEAAVDLAASLAQPGDTVLLAPACASFDQFESYAQRGDRFAALVMEKIGVGSR